MKFAGHGDPTLGYVYVAWKLGRTAERAVQSLTPVTFLVFLLGFLFFLASDGELTA